MRPRSRPDPGHRGRADLVPFQLAVDGRAGDTKVTGRGLAVPASRAQRGEERLALGSLQPALASAAGSVPVPAGQVIDGDVAGHRARERGGDDLAELAHVTRPLAAG